VLKCNKVSKTLEKVIEVLTCSQISLTSKSWFMQLTISYCTVTGLGLCHLLGSLRCLQDVKMVHMSWVSIEGFELALRSSCGKLKKVKLLSGLRDVLSSELLQTLQARGCCIRWVNKPLVFKG
jgi:F-box and leucine-rich repeat protein 2/20